MPNQRSIAGEGTVRGAVGTQANTPADADRQSTTRVDGSDVQANRTKKLQMVSAELKRMRYF